MTSFDVSALIDNFVAKIQDDHYLIKVLESLAAVASDLHPKAAQLVAAAVNTAEMNNAYSAVRRATDDAIKEFRQIKPSALFAEIARLEGDIRAFYKALPPRGAEMLDALLRVLAAFRDSYDLFIYAYGHAETIRMLHNAASLLASLQTNRSTLMVISAALRGEKPPLDESEDQIAFDFADPIGYEELLEKLRAFHRSYDEACKLLGIDAQDHPLRIIKLEIGSLHIELSGQSAVFALMIPLIKQIAGFIHRRYTREGRLKAWMAEGHEIVQLQRALADELKKHGLDSSGVEESWKASAETFAAELATFFSNHSVRINGEQVIIHSSAQLDGPPAQKQLPGPGTGGESK